MELDEVGNRLVPFIRVKLDDAVMRVFARRNAAYASNSEIFLFWMVGTSLVLLTVAILFLRNQIKPILRLAEAADSFGRGRPPPADFKPRGARTSTTPPFSSAKPSTRHSEVNLPICFGGKLTTAATCTPTMVSVV